MSYYIPRFERARNRYNEKDFNLALYFISYVPCSTLFLKGANRCGVTHFTKICTNFIEDWYENVGLEYKPYADIKPHPYGMVSVLPANFLTGVKEIYVYDEASSYAKNTGLWERNIEGDKKEIRMLMKPDEIREILLNDNQRLPRTFRKKELGDAEDLSIIYQHFSPLELNILASFRDVRKSDWCIEYAFRGWSTEFFRAVNLLKGGNSDEDIMESIKRIVRACEQIETKTHFILDDKPDSISMPNLIKKIKDEVIPNVADNKNAKNIAEEICTNLELYAPHLNEKYVLKLKREYKLNRENIYPLSMALMESLMEYYTNFLDALEAYALKGEIDFLQKSIEKKESLVGKVNTLKIRPDLKTIENEYNKLYRRESKLLRRFRVKGKRKERVDWDICGDGRGETW